MMLLEWDGYDYELSSSVSTGEGLADKFILKGLHISFRGKNNMREELKRTIVAVHLEHENDGWLSYIWITCALVSSESDRGETGMIKSISGAVRVLRCRFKIACHSSVGKCVPAKSGYGRLGAGQKMGLGFVFMTRRDSILTPCTPCTMTNYPMK